MMIDSSGRGAGCGGSGAAPPGRRGPAPGQARWWKKATLTTGQQDQRELDLQRRVAGQSDRIGAEQQQPGRRGDAEADPGTAQQQPRERGGGQFATGAEHPQVEQQRPAHQDGEADDVDRLDRGIEPAPAAHRLRERCGFEPAERRQQVRLKIHVLFRSVPARAVRGWAIVGSSSRRHPCGREPTSP